MPECYRPDDPPIVVNTRPVEAAALPRLIDGYDICIDDHSYMPTDMVAQCPALKHIVFLGTGASSYMDVPALAQRGVTVHTIKGYGDRAVAEHTIALMFACARSLARMDRARARRHLGPAGRRAARRQDARRARARRHRQRGCTYCARHRHAGGRLEPDPAARRTGPAVELDELLAQADVVSLHLALNDETRGIIDRTRIARMKRGVILINTARGALIDEQALIEALQSGQIGRAGLDVFHAEPLARDHPLVSMENVDVAPRMPPSVPWKLR